MGSPGAHFGSKLRSMKGLKAIECEKTMKNTTKMLSTVKPRYNAVSGRHLLRPRYKRGAL